MNISASTSSDMSERKIRKSTGPSTDPWGTPEMRVKMEESLPSTRTSCVLFERKFWIQTPNYPFTPMDFNFLSRRSWSTLSNFKRDQSLKFSPRIPKIKRLQRSIPSLKGNNLSYNLWPSDCIGQFGISRFSTVQWAKKKFWHWFELYF